MKNIIFILLSLNFLVLSCKDKKGSSNGNQPDGSGNPLIPFSYASIDIQPTLFTIDNSRDTLLFGKTGIMVYVPAKAFIARGSNTVLDLYLKEYTKPSETLAQNISNTSSDNQLLIASKIIHLEAKQGINQLSLSPNHDLRVHFKRIPKAPKISLWSGQPQAWTPLKFDQPKLFNHILKIGSYKEEHFANGDLIEAWEKSNLEITKEEELELWKQQQHLHLNYTISPTGAIKEVFFEEKISTDFQEKILAKMQHYPSCKPYINEKGEAVNTHCQYVFHVHQAEPKYKEDLNYLQILGQDYPELIAEKIDHIDDLEFKYHIFNIRKLGWIAAAQALEQPTSVDLVINVEPNFLAEVKIMLNRSKIILKGKRIGNKISFLGLPKNEAIQIIAFGEKNKQPLMASTQANSSDGVIDNLTFSTSSYEAIKSAIKKVN
ncbi:hypothetical protein [Aureispira anguillae]|uniref:Uncharacterized protein n=1 Tax=Aureispira anguillae TaxID=2864201 RepID=A0A915YB56_9BACT|nr:hypothetical protein [Aureispira anguillae]BDS09848.1 hypothetical protein AsAng_0005530 [Aureispira anguillae]